METIPEERFLREKRARQLWAPVVSHSMGSKDKLDRDRVEDMNRLAEMVSLLRFYVEVDAARPPYETFQAAMRICLGWLGVQCGLGKKLKNPYYYPAIGRWLLLTGADCV